MPPAAKMGDKVVGTDIHIVMIPSPGGPVPTPLPHPFAGTITGGCSTDVLIQSPPTNQGTVMKGSGTVLINNKPAARTGDTVMTCNDPAPAPTSSIVAVSTVDIGGEKKGARPAAGGGKGGGGGGTPP